MLLCRYIKRNRLCTEDFRDKFYIFNTYFFGKLEKALFQPVWSFFVMKSYFSYQMSCIMSLFKIGIIILFWVRNTWAPCNKFMLFFSQTVKRAAHPLVKNKWIISTQIQRRKNGHTHTHTHTPTQIVKLAYATRLREMYPNKRYVWHDRAQTGSSCRELDWTFFMDPTNHNCT